MFTPFSPTLVRLMPAVSRCLRWGAWVLLCVGLLLGVAWAALHFWIVPRIADHRPALERWAQQALGVPVRVGQVSAQSTGWMPTFELRDIQWPDAQGRSAVRLPKVLLAFSVRSVLGLQLEQLVLDAPELDIRWMADGTWRVAGMAWPQTPSGDGAMANWLFSQREVVVRDGVVRWHNERAVNMPATLRWHDVDGVLRNSARRHEVRVDATPPADWGQRFVTMGRFKRGLLSLQPGKWADWTGEVYGHFPSVDVAQWDAHVPWGMPIAKGQGSVRVWTDVVQGQWAGGVADVNLTGLQARWPSQEMPLNFAQLSGRLGARVHPQGFEAFTQHLAFVNDQGHAWPGGNVSLAYTHAQGARQASGHLQADRLDLLALREVALRLPMPQAWRQGLQRQMLSGQVQSLQWRWQGHWQSPDTYTGQATVQGLSLPPPRGGGDDPSSSAPFQWPGVKGANAKLDIHQDGGRLDVDMDATGAVFLPGILENPAVSVKTLQAQVVFKREAQQWHVPLWKLQLSNADLQGQWQGQWRSAATGRGPGTLAMHGVLNRLDAAQVHRYLPMALSSDVRHYVRDAVRQGTYSDVQVKIHGDLAKWPFANPKDGEFRLAGRVQDMVLDYVPPHLLSAQSLPWPRLHQLRGQLVFDRLGMKLSQAQARMGDPVTGVSLTGGEAEIVDMAHLPVLTVKTESKGPAAPLLTLVQTSALDALLSGALRTARATGTVHTRLQLAMPLLALQHTRVQGTVVLAGNDVRMLPAAPVLEKLQGTVQFTEAGFSLLGAQARLWGGPVRLEGGLQAAPDTAMVGAQAQPQLQLRAQGQITAEGLQQAQDIAPLNGWASRLSGATSYSAQWGWHAGQTELTVQSPLEGLAIQLPAPLGKVASATVPLSLRLRTQTVGGKPQDQLHLDWGQVASAHYVRDLSGPEPVVVRGQLTLGVSSTAAPALPATGVSAWVALDHFSLDDWQGVLPSPVPGGGGAPVPLAPEPRTWQAYWPMRIGVQANTFSADGRTLHQVLADGTRDGAAWRIHVDARELNGQIVFQQDTGAQWGHLYARLSRLNLPPSSIPEVESLLAAPPLNLPSLDIVVEQLELRGKKLGRIEIEAVNPEPQKARPQNVPEWRLNKLNIVLPEATLRSTGRWLTASGGDPRRQTEMDFKLEVLDAGALLTRLGTPDALRGGTGQLEGRVSWQGSPLALHYPSMAGQFAVQMGRGQFLKADAGAAKLLGVLSLQALPRRLLLDFRDVFYEGFAFDSVQGDVTITQGIAHTRNLHIQGVNALVQLDGSANIAQETQQLRAVILPAIDAGTASLLAGIALNPVVGVTTFLAQLFLQNPLTKANTQEFLIDGSWAEPRVTKITGAKKGLHDSSAPAGPAMVMP